MPALHDTLHVVPDDTAVAQALHWLESLAQREDWPPRAGFGLTLSVDEALTNIVSYAFADGRRSPPALSLAYRRRGADLIVDIRDNGHPYDPTLTQLPELAGALDESEEGGHGLRLMRHYLKDIRYQRMRGENRLTLVVATE
ncbi:ATP-binding protein [Bordetella sp. LUAb4]|uniref:ATP-binding protein n=1 Tax=Bordetella sp. LUAb4 TaxID=2843195 RepID=UPI001E28E762|nr:ATP-binding protein [Bordetella sp. LUAb4]